MNWKGIIGAGLTLVTGYLLYKTVSDEEQQQQDSARTASKRSPQNETAFKTPAASDVDSWNDPEDAVCVNYIPPQADEGFFSLSHDAQIAELISRVKEGSVEGIFKDIAASLDNFGSDVKEKRGERSRNYVLQLLVELLSMKDSRMMSETADVITRVSDNGDIESDTVNQRLDDTDFKESLLYVIRDRLTADHPLVESVIAAYAKESNPYNKYRMVRALGIVGGARVQAFLEEVVRHEATDNTFACQVARKYLKD